MKRCSKCGEEKPASEFGPERRNRDGLSSRCRQCDRERVQVYRAENRESVNARKRELYATEHDRHLRYSRTYQARHTGKTNAAALAWYKRNRDVVNARLRQRREANPEAFREYEQQKYQRKADQYRQTRRLHAAKRRGMIAANGVEPVRIERLIARDGLICHICHRPVPRGEVSLDHLVPIVAGGPHAEWNLALAHRRCNFRRGAGRTPAQLRLPF